MTVPEEHEHRVVHARWLDRRIGSAYARRTRTLPLVVLAGCSATPAGKPPVPPAAAVSFPRGFAGRTRGAAGPPIAIRDMPSGPVSWSSYLAAFGDPEFAAK